MTDRPSLLVVDDEIDNFDVIETLLDGEGYLLNYAASGQKALDRLDRIKPDVILLDVMMPEIDGIEVCRRIKANPSWQPIPVIMVTALTSKEDLARCLEGGADDFISKPLNGLELRSRVRSLLRIKQQYDNLQGLLDLRENMVNTIVHDLRNPLANIIFSAALLQRANFPPDKKEKKINEILQASHRLQALIDSLLVMAKLESGKIVLNRTPVDLHALCTSALADFEAIASQKNLQLIGDFPQPGNSISADAAIFRRVLDNLLSNAIKFSPADSQILLRADYLEAGGARVQVVDSGPGISEETQQSIFEKYEIGTRFEGVSQTGLGLAFCKMAIEAHGGTISVANNPPKGSIFTVEIGSESD